MRLILDNGNVIDCLDRPPDFECPYCGDNCVPVNFLLPLHLRLCDDCGSLQWRPRLPPVEPVLKDDPIVVDLRAILRKHLAGMGEKWRGCEFGKSIVGNAILGALQSRGYDPRKELDSAYAALRE